MAEQFDDDIKIKFTRKELEQLTDMYALYIDRWESDNEHEWLLLSHAVHLHRILVKQARNVPQNKFTIKLPEPAALAFYLWWQMINTSDQGYGNIIVLRIVGEIDKASKQLQVGKPEILNEG